MTSVNIVVVAMPPMTDGSFDGSGCFCGIGAGARSASCVGGKGAGLGGASGGGPYRKMAWLIIGSLGCRAWAAGSPASNRAAVTVAARSGSKSLMVGVPSELQLCGEMIRWLGQPFS
jgi:hypothetical protein